MIQCQLCQRLAQRVQSVLVEQNAQSVIQLVVQEEQGVKIHLEMILGVMVEFPLPW
jgi:hypothetical protein